MKFFKLLLQVVLMFLCFIAGMQYERTLLHREDENVSKLDNQQVEEIEEDILKDENIDVMPIGNEDSTDDSNGFGNENDLNEEVISNDGITVNTDSNGNTKSEVITTEEPAIIINDIPGSGNVNHENMIIDEQELIPQTTDHDSSFKNEVKVK